MDLNIKPYYDDFDETKRFTQIVFNPGRAVQARELTQIQSMFKNQLRRVSKAFFVNGDKIEGGKIGSGERQYFKVAGIPTNEYVGLVFTNGANKAKCKVTHIGKEVTFYNEDGTIKEKKDYSKYVFFEYIDTSIGEFAIGDSIWTESDVIINTKIVNEEDAIGKGTLAYIDAGVFYMDGSFHYVQPQEIIADHDQTIDKLKLGLVLVEEIVKAGDEMSLNDPASGHYNFNAPGADRVRANLYLTTSNDALKEYPSSKFVSISQTKKGQIISLPSQPEKDASLLDRTLARRTYDESGNYVVRRFPITATIDKDPDILETSNDPLYNKDQVRLKVEPGTAYVFGYRVSRSSSEYVYTPLIDENDEDNYTSVVGRDIQVEYGPFFLTQAIKTDGTHSTGLEYVQDTFSGGFPQIQNGHKYNIKNSTGGKIGVAKVRNFRRISTSASGVSQYEIYFEYPFESGNETVINNSVAELQYFDEATGAESGPNIKIQNGIQGNYSGNLVFDLPEENIKVVSTATRYVNRVKDNVNYSSGSGAVVTVNDTNTESISDNQYIIVVDDNNEIWEVDLQPANVNPNTQLSFTLPNEPTGNLSVYYQVKQSNIGGIEKTEIFDFTETVNVSSMEGNRIPLSKADINHVKSIISSNGEEMSHRFSIDNGQRDLVYGSGGLVYLGSDVSSDLGSSVTVSYTYFTRTNNSGILTVGSYSDEYKTTPVRYISKNSGKEFVLRDCVDLRPISNESTTDIVVPQSSLSISYEYYMSRIDKLVLTTNNTITTLNGIPALNPKPPADQVNTLSLYTMTIPPYLRHGSDIKFNAIDYKRYTMADIGSLEERINRLEYYTSLSLLEKSALETSINDATGTMEAFKNGILTDNFTSHAIGDITNGDYWCSISGGFLTSPAEANNVQFEHSWLKTSNAGLEYPSIYDGQTTIDLDGYSMDTGINFLTGVVDNNNTMYDNATSSSDDGGIKITSKTYTLTYKEVPILEQTYSSGVMNINPYNVFRYAGFLELTPSSDSWVETRDISPLTVEMDQGDTTEMWNALNAPLALTMDVQNTSDRIVGTSWDSWGNWQGGNWNGATQTSTRSGVQTLETTEEGIINQISSSNVKENIGNYVVDVSVVNKMRSMDIEFEGTGFKPNEIVDIYFDGINMINYTSHSIPTLNERKVEELDDTNIANHPIVGAPYIKVKIANYKTWSWQETFDYVSERLTNSWISTYITDDDSNDTSIEDHSGGSIFKTFPYDARRDNFHGFANLKQMKWNVAGLGTIYNDVWSGTYAYIMGMVADSANSEAIIYLSQIVGPEGFNKSYLKNIWSSEWESKTFGSQSNDLKLRIRTPWELSEMITSPRQGVDQIVPSNKIISQQAIDVVDWDGINMMMNDTTTGKYSLGEYPIDNDTSKKYHLSTDSSGNVKGVFHMPGGIFSVGTKTLRIQSPSDTTAGEANYTAFGTMQTKRDTILSYDVPMVEQEWISRERTTQQIVTDSRSRTIRWSDPLAQSFLTDFVEDVRDNNGDIKHRALEEGLYLSSIECWFSRKPSTSSPNKNTNVTLELRTMQNGIPTNMVIPGSVVNLHPDKVTSSGDAGVVPSSTKFSFTSPIYLDFAQEYCFVLLSDCDEYEVFTSTIGQSDVTTGNIITKQPYIGVMFKSQNGSTWNPMQESDVMFKMNRCKFDNDKLAQVILTPKVGIGAGFDDYKLFEGIDATTYLLNTTQAEPENTAIGWEWSTDGFNWTTLKAGVKDNFNGRMSFIDSEASNTDSTEIERMKAKPIFLRGTLASKYDNITPFIARERTNLILENNLTHYYEKLSGTQYLGNQAKVFAGDGRELIAGDRIPGIYITKPVTLNKPANSLRIYASVMEGISGGDVRFYYNTDGAPQQYIEIDCRSDIAQTYLALESYRNIIVITTSDNAEPTYSAYEAETQTWDSYAIIESYEITEYKDSDPTSLDHHGIKGRLYLSEINDAAEDDKGFILTHNNDGSTPKKIWIHPMYVNGEGIRHVEFDSQGQGADITAPLARVISNETQLEWKPMMLQTDLGKELTAEDIHTGSSNGGSGNPEVGDLIMRDSSLTASSVVLHPGEQFSEWELVPSVPSYLRDLQTDDLHRKAAFTHNSFSTFRVKIEIVAEDPLDVPVVKNLRSIAITA